MSPLREAIIVYVVSFVIPPIFFITLPLEFLVSNAYIIGTILEFFLVGFLCLLFAFLDRDSGKIYGLTSEGLKKSLMFGIVLIAFHAGFRYASGTAIFEPKLQALTQSLAQPFPYNLGFALFTGFAYGPLEVFYVVFLKVRFDQALGVASHRIISKGTIITAILFGLLHIGNIVFFGPMMIIVNVVKSIILALVLLIIFRYTGCSIGPMLYWTFANLT